MKYSVLGLGPSLIDYKGIEEVSIGVNDIYRFHKTDYVLCVDPKRVFTPDRLKVIESCSPKKFFSHLNEWSDHPSFEKIELLSPRGTVDFSNRKTPYSIMTPFCAIAMAIKMGATSVMVYGVDLSTHPTFSKPHKMKQAVNDLKALINASPVPIEFCQSSPINQLLKTSLP
jgi:hypothetical protein